ncbi:MAG: DUF3368 domain-containing protein [Bryobacteraceae bacterium]
MIVIADTSPLNYLLLLDRVELLRQLYGRVLIPEAVRQELCDPLAPKAVSAWAERLPDWVEVRAVDLTTESLAELDAGERSAILLAEQLAGPTLLLMDDAKGRIEAKRRGIRTTGTLGILRAASVERILRLDVVLPHLRQTNFFLGEDLYKSLLEEERERYL